MESVSVQLPAALYTAIYERYREETGTAIAACLSQLVDIDAGDKTRASPYSRPGPGTITGRVWEIADRIQQENGTASRESVTKACMDEGININTANTQFSHWQKMRLLIETRQWIETNF